MSITQDGSPLVLSNVQNASIPVTGTFFQATQPGSVADGADVTQGTTTDAVWSGSGAGTAIAILKKIASAGGSAVSIANGSDTAEGNTADTAYTSGSGTVISILKGIFGKLAGTLTVSGTVTTANNTTATVLTSASRTTTQTSADLTNTNGRYLQVILDMTVVGTGSVSISINGKDSTSGKYYPLLTGAAVTTNSTNVYRVGPSLNPSTGLVANDMIPSTFQIVVTANNANAATYSVGYNLGGN